MAVMMGGVGWITPKSLTTSTLMEFYICRDCRISHLKEVDTLHEGILIKEYATMTFLTNYTEQYTQGHTSHFSFHGTFKLEQHKIYLWKVRFRMP